MTKFTVVIPARFASTRLPGKPLLKIGNKTLIQRVIEKAVQSNASNVIVATDDERIANHVNEVANCSVVMTAPECESGTLRIAQAIDELSIDGEEIIVNLQGDEPFVEPSAINLVADALAQDKQASMSTLKEKIESPDQYSNENVVKVVVDKYDRALYFSRSLIPNISRYPDAQNVDVFKHIGLYAYRASYVQAYAKMPSTSLETIESLEQLRALYNGDVIVVKEVSMPESMGIDTPEDLEAANKLVRG